MPLPNGASSIDPGETTEVPEVSPLQCTQSTPLHENSPISNSDTRLPARDFSPPLVNCFGRSKENCTRVSLHAKGSYSSLQQTISTLLLGSSREEVYYRLQTFL